MNSDQPTIQPIVLMLLDNSFRSDARVEKEAKELIKAGYTLTVACTQDPSLPKEEIRDGYRILRIISEGYNAPLRNGYSAFLSSSAEELLNLEFDILHCHDFYMLSIGHVMKKRRPSIRLIYDAHEFLKGWPFYKNSTGLNKLKGRFVWKRLVKNEQREMRLADKVLTITSGIANEMRRHAQLKELPTVVGNYPQMIKVEPDPTYFREKYKLSDSTTLLIHTGTIYHSEQEVERLFSAIQMLPDTALIFVGNRPRFFELEQRVSTSATLDKCIFFHPYPENQEQVIQILANADIGLLHVQTHWQAHKIGFSNRYVEYIMAGIPVVATPQQFTEEFNRTNHCTAFYDGNSTPELTAAIMEIKNNLDAYKSRSKSARMELDWGVAAEKFLSLYAALNP